MIYIIVLNILFISLALNFYSSSANNNHFIYSKEKVSNFATLNMNHLNRINCTYPLKRVYISNILVFLLCRDRLYASSYSIKYWLYFKRMYGLKIIILDHFSTYFPLLEYYKILNNKYDVIIHKLNETSWTAAVDYEIPKIIKNYLSLNRNIKFYILSDIDIILVNIPTDIFNFYGTILDSCNVNVVGPSLMINDITPKFPDYKKVYEFESKYIKRYHYDVIYKNNYYSFVKADIDTIFGMRKRNTKFKRHSMLSFRSLAPYIAHHIDWYLTTNNLPKSFMYYINRTKSINHSGSAFNSSNSLNQP